MSSAEGDAGVASQARLIDLLPTLSVALLGLAMCSTATGNMERWATLHRAADAICEANGFPWQPPEAGPREKDIAALRQQMGERTFEAAYLRGHAMNRPDAIALALESEAQPT